MAMFNKEKIIGTLINKFFEDFKIKLLCFLLALGLYLSVGLFIQSTSKTYTVGIKIENLKENLVIANNIPKTVKIVVKDKPDVIDKISNDDFNVRLDLSDIQYPQKIKARLKWDIPAQMKSLFSGIKVDPEELEIETDEVVEKNVSIAINTIGIPAVGYIEKRAIVEPSLVRIQGPKALLEKINSVKTEKISLEGVKESFGRQVGLISDYQSIKVLGKVDIYFEIAEDTDVIKYYFYDAAFNNLKNNLKAKMNDEIEVELKSIKGSIKNINKESVGLFVDCSNINSPGDYFLDVNVKKSNDFNVISISPNKVRVLVEKK
jgi:hypothetical protein